MLNFFYRHRLWTHLVEQAHHKAEAVPCGDAKAKVEHPTPGRGEEVQVQSTSSYSS